MITEPNSESERGGADLKKTRRRKGEGGEPLRLDRLPPHALEAEQGVLGCVLLSPGECLGECIEKFKGQAEVFYDLRHRSIYEALVEMYDSKAAIDVLTLMQRLKDRQQLDAVGGAAYLSGLPDSVPSAANLDYYADIVWEKFILRNMIAACTNAIGPVYQ